VTAVSTDISGLQPITEGLFTWPSEAPQLIGSRCDNCGNVAFPAQSSCARCQGTATSEHLLAREGTLWTWTVQGFRPKSPPYTGPADFEPYPVGYVELPGEVKVETRLVEVTPAELRIGMPMELTIVPFVQESGDAVLTFAFRPVEATPRDREEPTRE
jgi:uncharacterized OB-fold protein